MVEHVKIPKMRVGVLIGEHGEVKKQIESQSQVKLTVDKEGSVTIEGNEDSRDPLAEWTGRDIVKAIGRGFNPTIALRLAEEQDTILDIIELKDHVHKDSKSMERIKGRVIGQEGKSRKYIESLTKCDICVFGKTISIIGTMDSVPIAHEAIVRLVDGQMHSTVYRFMERKRRELKIV